MVQESTPYNFTITNESSITRVKRLLNAANVIASGFKTTDIVFENKINYDAFLSSIQQEPFKVSRMYIQLVSNITFIDQIAVSQKNNTGETFLDILSPKLDPAQNLATIYNFNVDIPVDEFTSILFSMPPTSSIKVALYPSLIIDKSNKLIGENEFKEYKMPSISQFLF